MTTKMTTKLSEVADKPTAITNVLNYNDALNNADTLAPTARDDLLRTVSMARAWFAVQNGEAWYVAPAKYAGFVGMTPDYYSVNRVEISGTRGELALRQFAEAIKPVAKAHPAFSALMALTARFDRKPNTLANVCILHEEPTIQHEATLPILVAKAIEAVISLAVVLPPEGIAVLKRRITML